MSAVLLLARLVVEGLCAAVEQFLGEGPTPTVRWGED